MSTTRPFAYNPTEATIGGTTNIGKLCVGVSAQDYSINPGGIKWWMGPNEDPKYIIAKDYPPSNRPTPVGNIGTVFFKKCAKNDQAFINLVNHISGTSQTTVQDALTWLSANGYWTSYVPGIITTGLQLHLDAGDVSSYTGSGTTWYDLSGNSNNVDMQNSGSISWTDGGIGYFSTGSTGWFGKLNGSNMPTGNSLYTMSVWVKLPTTWNANGLIAIGTFGVANQSNAFRAGSTNQLLNYWWGNDLSVTSSVSPTDSWFNAVARFDGTTRKIFVNGVSVGSDTPTGHNVISSNIYVGKTYNNEYLNGIISQALIYNVSLSDAEVLANFNNTKSKFGL
jgi:hypothetical protein